MPRLLAVGCGAIVWLNLIPFVSLIRRQRCLWVQSKARSERVQLSGYDLTLENANVSRCLSLPLNFHICISGFIRPNNSLYRCIYFKSKLADLAEAHPVAASKRRAMLVSLISEE